jgi:hypothetical protein
MRQLLLFIVMSAAAVADPPAVPAPPGAAGTQAPAADKATPGKRRKAPRPLRCLRRLGRAETDLALRLSGWGIERPSTGR